MAPRMVYCMIWLTLEQKFVNEYDISTRQLQTCWLRHQWWHQYTNKAQSKSNHIRLIFCVQTAKFNDLAVFI